MWQKSFRFLLALGFLFFLFNFSYSVSFSPETLEKLKQEGRLDEIVNQMNRARLAGIDEPNPQPLIYDQTAFGPVQTIRALVILVDFSDHVKTYAAAKFDTILFTQNIFPTGSARDFYWENSYQKLNLIGDIVGWYRMPQTYQYYCYGQHGFGPYPHNAQKLTEDAVAAANAAGVDFSLYDNNGDGKVDALFVVHSGPGREDTGSENDIHSHAWNTYTTLYYDGVSISRYSMEPEQMASGVLVHIGVFCHEFGHVLGLPDLYDTDYSSEGVGNWSLMAGGSWNNNGITPSQFDGWGKMKLNWLQVDTIKANQTGVDIVQVETNPKIYRLWTNGQTGSQYFLVENRQKTKFDKNLPGEGLLIWHINESFPNNNNEPYYKVALEQADGLMHLENNNNAGEGGDPYPGNYENRTFDDLSNPASKDYNNAQTQVGVWNISNSDSVMQANLDILFSHPHITLDSLVIDDVSGGNGNGRAENGETVKIYFYSSNLMAPLYGAEVLGSSNNPNLQFPDNNSYLGDFLSNQQKNNLSDPITFQVPINFQPQVVTFNLEFRGNGGAYSEVKTFSRPVGNPDIFLVDDDNETGTYDVAKYFTPCLDSLEMIYDKWDKKVLSSFPNALTDYKIVIWFTGKQRTGVLDETEVQDMVDFLNQGGNLFLTSQDALEQLANSGTSLDSIFLKDYLHVGYGGGPATTLAFGALGDILTDSVNVLLDGFPGANNQTHTDVILPDSQAITIFKYGDPEYLVELDSVAGIRYSNDTFKVIFFGFGFEAINSSGQNIGVPTTKPKAVMDRILNWFLGRTYLPGDISMDGLVDISDIVYIINYVFYQGTPPQLMAAGDANGDCIIDISDIVLLINYVFYQGSAPVWGCAS
jgi:immune inhibitor A